MEMGFVPGTLVILVKRAPLGHPLELRVRGSHVSLRHPDGFAIMQALISRGVVGDFRAPDILRFGFAPLYTRFCDVEAAVMILKDIMDGDVWRDPAFSRRSAVT